MAMFTWRADDQLLARVRAVAAAAGHSSTNAFVTVVLDAATNPDLAGDDAARLRERLARAGVLAPAGPPRRRPSAQAVARAQAAASGGTPLAELVSEGR